MPREVPLFQKTLEARRWLEDEAEREASDKKDARPRWVESLGFFQGGRRELGVCRGWTRRFSELENLVSVLPSDEGLGSA